MNSFTRGGVAVVAAGALWAGYNAGTLPEIHRTPAVESLNDLGQATEDVSVDMGIDPAALPYRARVLRGNLDNPAESQIFKTVAELKRDGNELNFVPNPALNQEYSNIFQAALTDSDELIDAAFKRGTLEHIMFVVGLPPEELTASSHFDVAGKTVAVNISDNGMSYDELRAGLRHGLWDSLTTGIDFSDDETSRLVAEACDEIDAAYLPDSLQYLGTIVQELVELYQANRITHPRAYKHKIAALRSVERYLKAGQGATQVHQYCGLLSVKNSVGLLEGAAMENENRRVGKPSLITSMPDGLLEQVVNTTVREDLTKRVPMSFAFAIADESMYAQGPSMGSENLGPQAGPDNPVAYISSLLRAVTDDTEEFAGNIASLSPAERRISFAVLDLAVRKTSLANTGLAKMLVTAENNLQRRIASLLARQKSN